MNNVDIGRYGKRLIQYIWDPEPSPTISESPLPVWCLGLAYDLEARQFPLTAKLEAGAGEREAPDSAGLQLAREPHPSEASTESSFEEIKNDPKAAETLSQYRLDWPLSFLDDFESRIWMTYRSGFPKIAKSSDPRATGQMSLAVRFQSQLTAAQGFSSDAGWGCMIRSGQCLLANALALLRLGRGWRRGTPPTKEGEILRLFADDPSAPFSIHRFVEHGATACGTFPGQWFGPSATAKCIEALCNREVGSGLKVYVNGDGPDVFQDRLFELARDSQGVLTPTLLLIGTRLGIDRVTPAYWPALKACLQMPQSVGIAGGRPSASHYFVGLHHDDLYYLDPHHTRPALPLRACDNYTIDEVDSCHTRRLRRLPLVDMDPSMLIAFLIRDSNDWIDWKQRLANVGGKSIVHVADAEPTPRGAGGERDGAVDEVETLDTDDEDLTPQNAGASSAYTPPNTSSDA